MARRGRKPLAEPRAKINISLPIDMIARLDLRFMDPLKGQLAYGERSRYIESLIRQDEERNGPERLESSTEHDNDLPPNLPAISPGFSDEHR